MPQITLVEAPQLQMFLFMRIFQRFTQLNSNIVEVQITTNSNNTDNLYQVDNHSGTCSDIDHIWHVFIASPNQSSWNDGSIDDTVAHIHSWEYGCCEFNFDSWSFHSIFKFYRSFLLNTLMMILIQTLMIFLK